MSNNELLFKRRSIRSYTGEKISEAELQEILKAAYAAPVGMGRYDTLHLTVIQNADLIGEIEQLTSVMMEKITGMKKEHPLYGAPTLIVVSCEKPEHGRANVSYSNAAIVVHNMAVQATALDLGCVHIWGAIAAVNGCEETLAKLHLPEGYTACCALAIGKTDEAYELREIPEGRISTSVIE